MLPELFVGIDEAVVDGKSTLGGSSSAPSGPALSSVGGKLFPDKLEKGTNASPFSEKYKIYLLN